MLTGLIVLQKEFECFAGLALDEFEKEHIRLMNEIHIDMILQGLMSLEEARVLRFKKAFEFYGVASADELSYRAAEIYRNSYVTVNRLVPGAMELITHLKKDYKIGIVTNNLTEEQLRKIRFLKIDHLIDVMVTSEDAGFTKPNPAIFNMLLEKLNVMPEEAIMIGDHWRVDIEGASRLGIKCIWINVYGEDCPDKHLAVEVDSIFDTQRIISIIDEFASVQQ